MKLETIGRKMTSVFVAMIILALFVGCGWFGFGLGIAELISDFKAEIIVPIEIATDIVRILLFGICTWILFVFSFAAVAMCFVPTKVRLRPTRRYGK